MEFKAKEIAEILGGTVDGNPEAIVTTFARIESGKPGAICFYANPKYEHYVYGCKADIIIVNKTFEPKEPISESRIRMPPWLPFLTTSPQRKGHTRGIGDSGAAYAGARR